MRTSVRITTGDFETLHGHLFPGDHDEHAAFLLAGEKISPAGPRTLLVNEVLPVPAEQFVASPWAYRRVDSSAVGMAAMRAEDRGMRLIFAHCHPGSGPVEFSEPDRATHERAFPGLIRLTGDRPVASLVFSENAAAGELWQQDGGITEIDYIDVVGTRYQRLTPRPAGRARRGRERYDRQLLLFGSAGQAKLQQMTVAVLGAGGGGSLLVQALAHLGIGRIMVVDFDRVSETNLSRIVGSRPADVRRKRLKVDVMARMVHAIDPTIEVLPMTGSVVYVDDGRHIAEADFMFCATDTMEARYAFNAITHQFLIPGIQVGAKVVGRHDDTADGTIDLCFSVVRTVELDGPCMECRQAIHPELLRREQLNEHERRNQNYLGDFDDVGLADPSVITLNSVSTSIAITEFQSWVTGMLPDEPGDRSRVYYPADGEVHGFDHTRRSGCRFCDRTAAVTYFARGDDVTLPLRHGIQEVVKRTLMERVLLRLRR